MAWSIPEPRAGTFRRKKFHCFETILASRGGNISELKH